MPHPRGVVGEYRGFDKSWCQIPKYSKLIRNQNFKLWQFFLKNSKFSVMYQNLPWCKKHGSYTCRAVLRNFVGNIPALLNFVRKIPTHDIIPTLVRMIPKLVGMIPKLVGIIPTLQKDLTLCAKCRNLSYKMQQCGNVSYKILQKFSIKHYTCRNHASYTSVKFLPACVGTMLPTQV